MLKPVPLANAFTAIIIAFYLICWVIFRISPDLYNFLINAYSFGADVVSFFQPPHTVGAFVAALIISGITAWITGYAFAWLYNRWAK